MSDDPKIQWIPADVADWPPGLPKYDGDPVVTYPDGTKIDLNELEDPFSDGSPEEGEKG